MRELELQVEILSSKLVDRDDPPTLSADHVEVLLRRFRAESEAAARRAVAHERQSRALPADLYLDLENSFRGDSDAVLEEQTIYLNDVQLVESDAPVIDLGPGRGEWLQLLRNHAIAAFGVDDNPAMVETGRAQGLDVRQADLLSFLETAPEQSARAITMFHVVEHLELFALFAVLQHARRVLVPGGIFVAETPNIQNLAVASSGFWIDPTHVRPLHPELLCFLASAAGFEQVERRYLHPTLEPPTASEKATKKDRLLSQVIHDLYGAQDFTIIARRAPD